MIFLILIYNLQFQPHSIVFVRNSIWIYLIIASMKTNISAKYLLLSFLAIKLKNIKKYIEQKKNIFSNKFQLLKCLEIYDKNLYFSYNQ